MGRCVRCSKPWRGAIESTTLVPHPDLHTLVWHNPRELGSTGLQERKFCLRNKPISLIGFFQARSLASIFFFLLGAWWDQSVTNVFKKRRAACLQAVRDCIKR